MQKETFLRIFREKWSVLHQTNTSVQYTHIIKFTSPAKTGDVYLMCIFILYQRKRIYIFDMSLFFLKFFLIAKNWLSTLSSILAYR